MRLPGMFLGLLVLSVFMLLLGIVSSGHAANKGAGATPTPTVTNTGTPPTAAPTNTVVVPSATSTVGPCGAVYQGQGLTCTFPPSYDYSYSFRFDVEPGCQGTVTGTATVTFQVTVYTGGPYLDYDRQTRQVTFPQGPGSVVFSGTLTETPIPSEYVFFRILFDASDVVPGAYTQSGDLELCHTLLCTVAFNDVPPDSTFYPYIRCLACRGVVGGYPDGTFRPNNNVTRGQMVKILCGAWGCQEPVSWQTFQDVPPSSTFYEDIERFTSRGYMGGYPCGGPGEPCVPPENRPYFRPNRTATRGQLSKVAALSAGISDPPVGQPFEDVLPGSTFYTYTTQLVSLGIMSGYPCGGPGEPCMPPGNRPYFRPNNNVTRGQTAKITANAYFPGCNPPVK